ncbi:Uu.00g046610.m01.CDS01 [Anthostomella pinea]|uniref:Uu.00g046610.m01.CDS01 n=1 Tax=Anthostomella pinea TaxID=933095 RepID=A0AAI8VBH2_9PEZI|nr:Uu.00g046610.m01.CDS01 [Anthostomella pinea]
MNLPYQCLSALGTGGLFCAAKGTSIHTFDLGADPQFLSSWSHPLRFKQKQAENSKPQDGEDTPMEEAPGEQANDQPPSKKRKLDEGTEYSKAEAEVKVETENEDDDAATPEAPANGKGKGKNKGKGKDQKKPKSEYAAVRPEAPFVIILTATDDGSHVVAVTGQDKAIWTFEHDGKGASKELSQRVMPKRPCSISITSDKKTILCADKFGDVYALPLLPSSPAPLPSSSTPLLESPSTSTPDANASASADTASPAAQQQPKVHRGANTLTVHSQRNLRALEEQRKQLAKPREAPKDGRPTFEHELLLGHVSMLTAVTAARAPASSSSPDGSSSTRPYIITGDRDEHIRVSRGMPQAHVIETYCLGHESFVGALCIPGPQPKILISGGGDADLLVWDWRAGTLLGRTEILGRVREVVQDAAKVAVAKLYSYEAELGCFVVAICERVPALFIFQLKDNNTLEHVQTLQLPGNVLDVTAVKAANSQTPKLVAAVDPTNDAESNHLDNNFQQSLLLFELDGSGSTWTPKGTIQGGPAASEDLEVARDELDKVLYTVEQLRKTELRDETEQGEPSEKYYKKLPVPDLD